MIHDGTQIPCLLSVYKLLTEDVLKIHDSYFISIFQICVMKNVTYSDTFNRVWMEIATLIT